MSLNAYNVLISVPCLPMEPRCIPQARCLPFGYPLIYSIAISWYTDWSELPMYGSSEGYKKTELGICAAAGCSPAFPEFPFCEKTCCCCSPSSPLSLSSRMSVLHEVGLGSDLTSPPWSLQLQWPPWVTLWLQCHLQSSPALLQLLLHFWGAGLCLPWTDSDAWPR